MFSLVSGIYDTYFAPVKLNLLVVGAPSSGKTALLERLKVTEFNKKRRPDLLRAELDLPREFLPKSLQYHSPENSPKKFTPAKKKVEPKRRFLVCPAPSRYANASTDDDDDEILVEEEAEESDAPTSLEAQESQTSLDLLVARPDPVAIDSTNRLTSAESLEDVPLSPRSEKLLVSPSNVGSMGTKESSSEQEFDLKPKKKMLPLQKIRPTIGMNLGKVDICGATCHVWDLGGKLQDLWVRYYLDCDAIVFVWKVTNEDQESKSLRKETIDEEDEEPSQMTPEQQLRLLEMVREEIPDDVPFLILGHHFSTDQDNSIYCFDKPYSTSSLITRYHNPLMSLFFGSASTGRGVREAMEWLIPLAKQQQRVREKNQVEDLDEETEKL